MILAPLLEKRIEFEPNSGCWLWIGRLGARGYPLYDLNCSPKKTRRVSRLLYEMYIGGIDDGLELDHLCKTPICVNPLHLEPVTHAENMRRWALTIVPATHCKYGHEYAVAGFYWLGPPYNERVCKACVKIKNDRRPRSKSTSLHAQTARTNIAYGRDIKWLKRGKGFAFSAGVKKGLARRLIVMPTIFQPKAPKIVSGAFWALSRYLYPALT